MILKKRKKKRLELVGVLSVVPALIRYSLRMRALATYLLLALLK